MPSVLMMSGSSTPATWTLVEEKSPSLPLVGAESAAGTAESSAIISASSAINGSGMPNRGPSSRP